MKGKLISSKMEDTIIEAVNNAWIVDEGIPSVGFLTDNGGEFSNAKIDDLTSKLSITVMFGPA